MVGMMVDGEARATSTSIYSMSGVSGCGCMSMCRVLSFDVVCGVVSLQFGDLVGCDVCFSF